VKPGTPVVITLPGPLRGKRGHVAFPRWRDREHANLVPVDLGAGRFVGLPADAIEPTTRAGQLKLFKKR
jgi:hypothetical protein